MRKSNVTFDFYYNEYLVGTEPYIPMKDFERFVRMAADEILPYIAENGFDTEVGLTLCEAAEYLYSKAKHRGIASESIDGYRVDYTSAAPESAELIKIASARLGRLGLMYMGVE